MVPDRPLRFGPEVARAAGAVAAIAGDERPPARQGDDGASWCASALDHPAREAQAAAREIEHLLAAGEVRPEAVCVIVGSGWREAPGRGRARGARGPFRFAGDAALFQRPEVRDVLAWLRMLADPTDRPRSSGRSPGRRSSCARSTSRAAPPSRGGASST